MLDANLEGILSLLRGGHKADDTWTKRAVRNLPRNLEALKNASTYGNIDRYTRSVKDISRVLQMAAPECGTAVGLANYHHNELSPLRSSDLLRAAETHCENPFYPYFKKRLSALVQPGNFSAVGFSLNFLSQALCTFAMAGYLKKTFPEIAIILGGGLATSWMRKPSWENPFTGLIDRFVAGPGEQKLISLLGKEITELTSFTPDYGTLPLSDYLSPGVVLPYSGSSGCSWRRCSFCPEKSEGNPYIPVPASRVADDIAVLSRKLDPLLIHFLDSSMSLSLMKGMIANPPGRAWYGFTRVGDHLADREFCLSLRRSGCVMLKLGLESGDQDVLAAMGKGTDISTASKALKMLKHAGIATYVYLLFGTPYETQESARKTLSFVVSHQKEITFLNLAIFNMPVHAPEANALGTQTFYDGDLSLYTDFRHPRGWNRKQVREFLENEFRKHPAVAAIVKRDLPVFTSNHAAFSLLHGPAESFI